MQKENPQKENHTVVTPTPIALIMAIVAANLIQLFGMTGNVYDYGAGLSCLAYYISLFIKNVTAVERDRVVAFTGRKISVQQHLNRPIEDQFTRKRTRWIEQTWNLLSFLNTFMYSGQHSEIVDLVVMNPPFKKVIWWLYIASYHFRKTNMANQFIVMLAPLDSRAAGEETC